MLKSIQETKRHLLDFAKKISQADEDRVQLSRSKSAEKQEGELQKSRYDHPVYEKKSTLNLEDYGDRSYSSALQHNRTIQSPASPTVQVREDKDK